jgi:hypothetical protein
MLTEKFNMHYGWYPKEYAQALQKVEEHALRKKQFETHNLAPDGNLMDVTDWDPKVTPISIFREIAKKAQAQILGKCLDDKE